MDTFFGTADSYSHHLVALGHEAHEVIANAAPLQAAWLREHGVRARRVLERWRREAVVTAQAEDFRPDVVYVQNLHFLGPRTLDRLRSIAGSVVGQIASEPPRGALLRRFDLVLTSFPHFVETFRREGVSSEYFRLGFDERVLRRLEEEGAPTELAGAVFVGALNRRQHSTANALLERAARQAPIEFWGCSDLLHASVGSAGEDHPPSETGKRESRKVQLEVCRSHARSMANGFHFTESPHRWFRALLHPLNSPNSFAADERTSTATGFAEGRCRVLRGGGRWHG